MTYGADAPTMALDFERLRSQQRRRHAERNTSNRPPSPLGTGGPQFVASFLTYIDGFRSSENSESAISSGC
jgi:hypothetical protein